jgi:hypothetical protein
VGETIDRTRVEIAAQRAELEATAAELRAALDIPARVRENPLPVLGVTAALAFLLVGGPKRILRALRSKAASREALAAYEQLPSPMKAWVDVMTDGAGASGARAREGWMEELKRWRREPVRDKKARAQLARQMVEGPPGPQRTLWVAAETALTLVAAALARRAIARFLTNEPNGPSRPPLRMDEPAAPAAPAGPGADPVSGPAAAASYAGISARGRSSEAP